MECCRFSAARAWGWPKTWNHTVRDKAPIVHTAIIQRIESVLLHELLLVQLLQLLLLLKKLQIDRGLTEGCTTGRDTARLLW